MLLDLFGLLERGRAMYYGGVGGRGYRKKDYYIERDGRILLFRSPEDVEAYLAAESKPIKKRKHTERPAEPMRIEVKKIKQALPSIKPDIQPETVDAMVQEMDWSALLKLQKALERWQNEEDMKLLLVLT